MIRSMRELSEQELVRREKLTHIENPYPERFPINYEIVDARNLPDETAGVRVAGRIILMRKMGKMSFLTISDIYSKIQVSVKVDMIGEESYALFKANYDIGDFIGVEGETFTTHTGEKTIRAQRLEFLGKALKPLPEKFHGATDVEMLYRQRYLDLISNDDAKKKFLVPYKVINNESILECIKVDKVLVDGKCINVLLGLCEKSIFKDNIDVILNDSLREMI